MRVSIARARFGPLRPNAAPRTYPVQLPFQSLGRDIGPLRLYDEIHKEGAEKVSIARARFGPLRRHARQSRRRQRSGRFNRSGAIRATPTSTSCEFADPHNQGFNRSGTIGPLRLPVCQLGQVADVGFNRSGANRATPTLRTPPARLTLPAVSIARQRFGPLRRYSLQAPTRPLPHVSIARARFGPLRPHDRREQIEGDLVSIARARFGPLRHAEPAPACDRLRTSFNRSGAIRATPTDCESPALRRRKIVSMARARFGPLRR